MSIVRICDMSVCVKKERLYVDLHIPSCSFCSAPVIERAGQIAQWGSNWVTPPPPSSFSVRVSQAVSVEQCWRLRGGCGKLLRTQSGRVADRERLDWRPFSERYKTQCDTSTSLHQRGRCGSTSRIWKRWATGVGGGVMVVVWLPQERAWQAVLLVTGLVSLTCGAHGEYIDSESLWGW